MKLLDETELRALLEAYESPEPSASLVERTKRLMREESALCTVSVTARQQQWAFILIASAALLTLNFFYMLSVGTVLRMLIPPRFAVYVSHSIFAFTAAQACLYLGMSVTIFLGHARTGTGSRPQVAGMTA